ncbi:unnamed protein product [Protopolystoma xenopodis]|uniref:Uncharacterized protein n=1 Tax=Protopolystoma xenopodis TaxID=117903 RepID=A0A448WTV2_9PLAT|nr:unnamed protein product [Protopolystoma xenopodis]
MPCHKLADFLNDLRTLATAHKLPLPPIAGLSPAVSLLSTHPLNTARKPTTFSYLASADDGHTDDEGGVNFDEATNFLVDSGSIFHSDSGPLESGHIGSTLSSDCLMVTDTTTTAARKRWATSRSNGPTSKSIDDETDWKPSSPDAGNMVAEAGSTNGDPAPSRPSGLRLDRGVSLGVDTTKFTMPLADETSGSELYTSSTTRCAADEGEVQLEAGRLVTLNNGRRSGEPRDTTRQLLRAALEMGGVRQTNGLQASSGFTGADGSQDMLEGRDPAGQNVELDMEGSQKPEVSRQLSSS